jgi:hypothetical protein
MDRKQLLLAIDLLITKQIVNLEEDLSEEEFSTLQEE